MRTLWEDRAWDDYIYWQTQDKKTLKRINALIPIIIPSFIVYVNSSQAQSSTSCSKVTYI